MKKIIFTLIICVSFAFAKDNANSKLIVSIAGLLMDNNNSIIVYSNNDNYKIKGEHKRFINTTDCTKANLLILKNVHEVDAKCFKKDPIILTTTYKDYMKSSISIGAIFWQKGRLNLIFKKSMLDKKSISLPNQYDKYIE